MKKTAEYGSLFLGRDFGGVRPIAAFGVNAHIGGFTGLASATEKGGISPEHNAGDGGTDF